MHSQIRMMGIFTFDVYDEGALFATAKLMSAYMASEAMRRDLVEAWQKAKEKEEDPVKKAKIDEDAPGN